jgi:hypothetical protein
MAEPNHKPFTLDCPCRECKSYRDKKQAQQEQEQRFAQEAERTFGKNWKNVVRGMGDQ